RSWTRGWTAGSEGEENGPGATRWTQVAGTLDTSTVPKVAHCVTGSGNDGQTGFRRTAVGVVRRAHQRPRRDVGEAQRQAEGLEVLVLVRRPVAHHRVVVRAGLQVLADGDHVHVVRAQVAQGLFDLFALLAQAEHDPGLGDHVR